jgi:hypothetical protein
MAHGGKRPGAGRKKIAAKRVMLKLSEEDAARLERQQKKRDESASDVLRAGLALLDEQG